MRLFSRFLTSSAVLTFSLLGIACSDPADEEAPPAAWVGKTYLLTIPVGNWSEPSSSIGGEFGPFVPEFIIKVNGDSGSNLDVTFGTATGGVQDLCNPTVRVPTSEAYPAMQLGPAAVKLHLKHNEDPVQVAATAHNFTLTDVLPTSDSGAMTTTLDMRDLYPMFTILPAPSPEAVCNALGDYDAACEACPHDGAVFCLTLEAIFLEAAESAMALETVDASKLTDPSCIMIPE